MDEGALEQGLLHEDFGFLKEPKEMSLLVDLQDFHIFSGCLQGIL